MKTFLQITGFTLYVALVVVNALAGNYAVVAALITVALINS